MKVRHAVSVIALFLSPVGLGIASAAAPRAGVDTPAPAPAQFQVSDKTEIPGETLKPGTYTIHVVDRLQDRVILRIESTSGKKTITFLGLPTTSLAGSGSGPIIWGKDANGKSALRGFSFPDGTTVEFVYPKAEAVALAKSNDTHVMAIDPKSEGMVELPKLSKGDMRLVTLWVLTPTQVGPQEGIAAQRYQPPAGEQATAEQTASVSAPRHLRRRSEASEPAPQETASVRPPRHVRPAISSLPHTASNTPLLLMAAFLFLFGAAALGLRRAL